MTREMYILYIKESRIVLYYFNKKFRNTVLKWEFSFDLMGSWRADRDG